LCSIAAFIICVDKLERYVSYEQSGTYLLEGKTSFLESPPNSGDVDLDTTSFVQFLLHLIKVGVQGMFKDSVHKLGMK
jgi:hypothetical protein